jgi:hypothetical protein
MGVMGNVLMPMTPVVARRTPSRAMKGTFAARRILPSQSATFWCNRPGCIVQARHPHHNDTLLPYLTSSSLIGRRSAAEISAASNTRWV